MWLRKRHLELLKKYAKTKGISTQQIRVLHPGEGRVELIVIRKGGVAGHKEDRISTLAIEHDELIEVSVNKDYKE